MLTSPSAAIVLEPPPPHPIAGNQRDPHAESALCVLVVEDDPPVRDACVEIARSLGFVTASADSVPAARAALARVVDIVLLDLRLPGGDGRSLLDEIRARHPSAVVVVMTAFATVNSAVEAWRVGAGDYLPKPFTLEELSDTLERAASRRSFDAESRRLRERLRTGRAEGALIGQAAGMEKLYRILSKVAYTAHPVLILGESGTGKSVVARAIHMNGPRASEPFFTIDCSAPPAVVERELFGEAGDFAGANKAIPGLLASPRAGTVLLDEVGELPLDLQTRLLRALQERAVRPERASEAIPISVRILAANSRDLHGMVESGRFRKDLFFRLNVVNLRVPALRERKPDIPLLVAQTLERIRYERGHSYSMADETLRLLSAYDWPGNIRELEHAIERACALSSGPVLHFGDLPTQLHDVQRHQQTAPGDPAAAPPSPIALEAAAEHDSSGAVLPMAEVEKQVILRTLRQLNGDKLMAARLLGIGKTTLYRKLKEYELTEDET